MALFRETMDSVEDVMNEEYKIAINGTPFGHFCKFEKEKTSLHRLEAILGCYEHERTAFVFGNGKVILKFSGAELSCVLGLHFVGQFVDMALVAPSETANRLFEGRTDGVRRKEVVDAFRRTVREGGSHEDVARLYILLVFSLILLPVGHAYVQPCLFHYMDNLQTIGEYAWGVVVYRMLKNSLTKHSAEGKTYIDGCTMGLVVSFW